MSKATSLTGFKSDFMATMAERGFVRQCTDGQALDAALARGRRTAFVGFDATARSLHAGHLLSLMVLRWLRMAGHVPIILIGGATTMIGDPSFRDAARPLLDRAGIDLNSAELRRQASAIVGDDAIVEDNRSWLDDARLIDTLREVWLHIPASRLLAMESMRSRLSDGLSMMEFAYPMLQATDFLELSRRHGCILQMGGSDQWGNICLGLDLARRIDGRELFGLTTPLLETASGRKMGKTASGAVWLSDAFLPVLGFWQFWRNVDDADVPRFLRLFTELPMSEVGRLSDLRGSEINEAKRILATCVTSIVHGREAALHAEREAAALFSVGSDEVRERADVRLGTSVVDLLVDLGLAGTKGEARRTIRGRGMRIGGCPVKDESAKLERIEETLVQVGKRRRAAIRVT